MIDNLLGQNGKYCSNVNHLDQQKDFTGTADLVIQNWKSTIASSVLFR